VSSNSSKSAKSLKAIGSTELYTNNGEKLEILDEQVDDLLVTGPIAQRKIEGKLKSQKFMRRLQSESE
jgi:hypothetical protein